MAENVPGLLTLQDGVVFEGVCADLETEGYEVFPLILPACAQGAPHRRNRVWIVGYANEKGFQRYGKYGECIRKWITGKADCHAPDTESKGLERGMQSGFSTYNYQWQSWNENWYEVATRLCRVDDGIPNRVDRLKCLGNAIVPQVAFQIFKAIKETE